MSFFLFFGNCVISFVVLPALILTRFYLSLPYYFECSSAQPYHVYSPQNINFLSVKLNCSMFVL